MNILILNHHRSWLVLFFSFNSPQKDDENSIRRRRIHLPRFVGNVHRKYETGSDGHQQRHLRVGRWDEDVPGWRHQDQWTIRGFVRNPNPWWRSSSSVCQLIDTEVQRRNTWFEIIMTSLKHNMAGVYDCIKRGRDCMKHCVDRSTPPD